jgi:hypothetical protein
VGAFFTELFPPASAAPAKTSPTTWVEVSELSSPRWSDTSAIACRSASPSPFAVTGYLLMILGVLFLLETRGLELTEREPFPKF